MFKAGKTIRIHSINFKNIFGMHIAPVIEFNGIYLTADKPISKEVMEFFQSKGAIIEQLTEADDKMVRLTGKFQITKKEVQEFLSKHPELEIIPDATIEKLPAPKQHSKQIDQELSKPDKPKKFIFIQKLKQEKIKIRKGKKKKKIIQQPKSETAECVLVNIDNFKMHVPEGPISIKFSQMYSKTRLDLDAATDIHSVGGISSLVPSSGVLAKMIVGKEANFKAGKKLLLENTLCLSGEHILLSGGEEIACSMTPDITWINTVDSPLLSFDYKSKISRAPERSSVVSASSDKESGMALGIAPATGTGPTTERESTSSDTLFNRLKEEFLSVKKHFF